MRQWTVLFKKETKESWRNYKWLWIPIVFIILGITQPVTSYYLADILENFGGLPEGTIANIPVPTAPQVLSETLGQFSQIGFLVLVLAFMGIVAGEKSQGTHVMILVKPVSFAKYLTAKWVHMLMISISSYLLGFIAATYYTFLLIGSLPMSNVIGGALVYALWISFIMTIVLCLSALMKSSALVAITTLGFTVIISLLSSLTPELMRWSPGMLTSHSQSIFHTGKGAEDFALSFSFTLIMIFVMIFTSIYFFNRKEMVAETE